MEDGRIPDDSLSASSTYGDRPDHSPVMARLNTNCQYYITNRNTSLADCMYSVRFSWHSLLHSCDSTFVKQKAGKRSVPRMSTGNDHFVLDNWTLGVEYHDVINGCFILTFLFGQPMPLRGALAVTVLTPTLGFKLTSRPRCTSLLSSLKGVKIWMNGWQSTRWHKVTMVRPGSTWPMETGHQQRSVAWVTLNNFHLPFYHMNL